MRAADHAATYQSDRGLPRVITEEAGFLRRADWVVMTTDTNTAASASASSHFDVASMGRPRSWFLLRSPDLAWVFLNHWGGGGTGKGVGEFRYVYDKAIDAVATGRMWIDLCVQA
jgi:hypothetical protein